MLKFWALIGIRFPARIEYQTVSTVERHLRVTGRYLRGGGVMVLVDGVTAYKGLSSGSTPK